MVLIIIVLMPHFTADFLDLRQKKENEENYRKELARKEVEEKAKKDAEEKIYLLGKFDPSRGENFSPIPAQFNIGGYKMYLRRETLDAFLKMRDAAEKDTVDLKIISATRNFNYQKELWNNKWTGIKIVDGQNLAKSILDEQERFKKILEYSAVPGTSRHHWGTDIDINGAEPAYFNSPKGAKEYEWLVKNAPFFGFCQTYNLKGSERPTGYNEEKWHWSYLPLSRKFTEDYKNLIKDEDIKGFNGDEYVSGENLINNYVLTINPECI